MLRLLKIIFILGPSFFNSNQALADWVKINERNQVQVFQEKNTGSELMGFKGEGLIKAPFARVASVIFDTERAKEWVDDLEETRIVKWFTETAFLEYDHMGAPILISDRDFVSKVDLVFDKDQTQLSFLMKNATGDEVPAELVKSKGVRGSLDGSRYILKSAENGLSTFLIGEVHADPKGALPKWLVNAFQKSWPIDTIVNLRKQVAKPDIKIDAKLMNLLKTHLNLSPSELGENSLSN